MGSLQAVVPPLVLDVLVVLVQEIVYQRPLMMLEAGVVTLPLGRERADFHHSVALRV